MADDPPKVFQQVLTTTTGQQVEVTKAVEKSVVVQTPIKSEAAPPADQPPPRQPNAGWMHGMDDQPARRPPNYAALDNPSSWVPSPSLPPGQLTGVSATGSAGEIRGQSSPPPETIAIVAHQDDPAQSTVALSPSSLAVGIAPTAYLREPGGAIIVQNHTTINISSVELRELKSKPDDVIRLLRSSNE